MDRIGVIGAGAWGTALATVARRAGRDVILQGREPEVVAAIGGGHGNTLFLPGVALDPAIHATTDGAEAIAADAVLLATRLRCWAGVAAGLAAAWRPGVPAVVCSKGIEQDTLSLMSEVVAEVLPMAPVAVLSGPSFAGEVARDRPTAVTLAATDPSLCRQLSEALGTPRFRIYGSDDPVGAEIGGAVKNVLAIACGIVEGRALGDNARAALTTRGLAEIARLGTAKGARAETLMGLSGIGDLILTCNNIQSRNFSLGVALGEGAALDDVLGSRNSVAEGVFSATSVSDLARRLDVEMPICVAVDGILNHYADIDATIAALLARPFKGEAP